VLTTPALQLLKEHRPDLRIGVAVEERFREIFQDSPAVDEILGPSIGAVRGFGPQLCINFHGGTRSAWMTALSGARCRAGFGHYRMGFAYNVKIPRAQEILGVERKVHTAEHLASAMFYLGVPQREIPASRVGLPADHLEAQGKPGVSSSIQRVGREADPTCIIHAVAAMAEKTWPAERFLEVAQYLADSGFEPVFIGAASDDLSPFAAYQSIQGASLTEIKSLLASASLFIGNDSGPAHMAAAFGLPVVVIFGSSDPEIWGPWRTAGEVVRDPAGITAVPVARVIEALGRVRVHA
jgi:ADP-heptose:LPS heptosyltransferase